MKYLNSGILSLITVQVVLPTIRRWRYNNYHTLTVNRYRAFELKKWVDEYNLLLSDTGSFDLEETLFDPGPSMIVDSQVRQQLSRIGLY